MRYPVCKVSCRSCEKEFMVPAKANAAHPDHDLCLECITFRNAMEQLMAPREWEQKPVVNRSLYKGIGWGFLSMSSLLGACWAIVNWLR